MELQTGTVDGKPIVYVWLSKSESDDKIVNEILKELKDKYKLCTYHSGTAPAEEAVRKMILDIV